LDEPDARVILAVVFEQPTRPTTPTGQHGPGRPATRIAAVVVAGATSASILLLTHTNRPPADFLTYRYAAALAAHGGNVYAGDIHGPNLGGQPFTYPPVATVVLWPTTRLTPHAAYLAWTVATLAVLAAALSIGTAVSARGTAALAVAVVVAGNTDLLSDHLQVGQINVLLMGLCLWDLTRADRSTLGRRCPRGVFIGVAAAIKLTPGLFVVHFVLTRQWRLAAFAALGCAAATGVGALTQPDATATFAGSVFWTLTDRVDLGHPLSYTGNQSLTGVLAAAGVPGGPATTVIVLAVGAGALTAARYVHTRGRELDAALIVGMSAPLLAPFSWNHHYVFVLPALALLARRWWPSRPVATAVGVVAVVALLCPSPATGAALLRDGPWWAAALGAAERENAVLAAVAVGTALVWGARGAARR